MTPFAFDPDGKPPGRTCQGFAIPIAALRAPLTEPARPQRALGRRRRELLSKGFGCGFSHCLWTIPRGKATMMAALVNPSVKAL